MGKMGPSVSSINLCPSVPKSLRSKPTHSGIAIILTEKMSLAALEVNLTTSSAAGDNSFVEMTTFSSHG